MTLSTSGKMFLRSASMTAHLETPVCRIYRSTDIYLQSPVGPNPAVYGPRHPPSDSSLRVGGGPSQRSEDIGDGCGQQEEPITLWDSPTDTVESSLGTSSPSSHQLPDQRSAEDGGLLHTLTSSISLWYTAGADGSRAGDRLSGTRSPPGP